MSGGSNLQDAVAHKLQYYMTIKRREEDFDGTARHRPSSSRVLLLGKPQPMVSHSQMKDRSLKHYFTSPMIRSQIAKLEAMPPGTEREKDVKSTVVRKMRKNRRTSFEELSMADPQVRSEAYKAQIKALKMLKRDTSSRLYHQIDYGGRLSRKMLSPNLSKGEANRIVDHASQILVATETVALAQEILDDQYLPRRHKRPQSAPVHLPQARDEFTSEQLHGSTRKTRKRRPKYCWDINGRRVSYRQNAKTRRPGSASSEYSTTTLDDSEYEYMHSRRPNRPMSAKEPRYPPQSTSKHMLRDRPYSADALYLRSYGKAMPSDSRRGFAYGNYVYAMDMATQTVQDVGLQTDLSGKKPQPPSDIRKYYIKVTTGGRAAAGTRADVYVVLQGKKRRSDEIFLTETLGGGRPFKRGQIDEFMIETENVGQIVRLGIGHDQEEKDFSWFVVSVEVKSGSEYWQFPCNQWLSGCFHDKETFKYFKAAIISEKTHARRLRSSSSSTDISQSSRSSHTSHSEEIRKRHHRVKKQVSSRSSSRSSDREHALKVQRPHRQRKTSSRSSTSHQSSQRESNAGTTRLQLESSTHGKMSASENKSNLDTSSKSLKPKIRDGSDIEYSSDHSKDGSGRAAESIVEESIDSSSDSSTITSGSIKRDQTEDVIKAINAMNRQVESASSFSETDPARLKRKGSLFENLNAQSSSDDEKQKEKIVEVHRSSSSSSSSSEDSQHESFFDQKIVSPLPPALQQESVPPPIVHNDTLPTEHTSVTVVERNVQNEHIADKPINTNVKDDRSSSSLSSDSEKRKNLLPKVSIEDSSSDSSSESDIEENQDISRVIEKEQDRKQEDVNVNVIMDKDDKQGEAVLSPKMYPIENNVNSSSSSSSSSSEDEENTQVAASPQRKVSVASVSQEFPTSLSMAFPIKHPSVEAPIVVEDQEPQVASVQHPIALHEPPAKDTSSDSSISEEVNLLSSSSSEEEDLMPPPKVQTPLVKEDKDDDNSVTVVVKDHQNRITQPVQEGATAPSRDSESDSETLISSGESGEELSSTSSDEDEPIKIQPSPTSVKQIETIATEPAESIKPILATDISHQHQEHMVIFHDPSPSKPSVAPLSVIADVHEPTSGSPGSSTSTSSSSEEEDYVLDENDIYHAILNDDADRVHAIIVKHPTVINNPFDNDQTPLQYAASHGKVRMVKFLLENKADCNAENKAGYTAIHLAAKNGHLQSVQIMKTFGVSVESENIEGQTPLHVAAISDQLDVVKWLALNGANVKAKDKGGRSAVGLAKQNHNERIVTFLTNFMKKKNIMESSSSSSSLLSSTSSSSSSSSESEEEQKVRAPRRSVVDALAKREQEELEEKKRIYEQQQNNMKKRRISFLDEIRMENE